MKQALQLRLSQHLALTPQLQQSIRLLQLSTLELNAEIEQALQENPLLEREDGFEVGYSQSIEPRSSSSDATNSPTDATESPEVGKSGRNTLGN